MARSFVWISLLSVASVLTSPLAYAAPEAPDTRVTGGSQAKTCAWPSVMLLGTHAPGTGAEAGCTGTLVHPQLVLYAAHCGDAYIMISSETRKGKRVLKKPDFAAIGRHPSWKNDSMTQVDWAFIKLKEPITDTPITPVVAGCEYPEIQKTGAPVIFSGFSKNNSTSMDAIILRWAKTKITSIAGGKINAGGGGTTACQGDSGGPMLAKLPDGSWRTVGIASTISNVKGCGKGGVWNSYAQINRKLIEWVESSSGLDITPCFDLDNKPTPGPACDAFMAYAGDPNSPQGKRDNHCADAKTIPAGNFCQVPKDEPKDDTTSAGETGEEDTSTGGEGTEDTSTGGESTEDSSGNEDTTQEPSPEPSQDSPEPSEPSEPSPDPGEDSENTETPSSGEPSPSPDPKDPSPKKQSPPEPQDSGAPSEEGGCKLHAQDPSAPALGLSLLLGLVALRRPKRRI